MVKKISHSGTCAILATPTLPPRGGGGEGVERSCIAFEISWVVLMSLYFLASEKQTPKQLKQVSIVGSLLQISLLSEKFNGLELTAPNVNS